MGASGSAVAAVLLRNAAICAVIGAIAAATALAMRSSRPGSASEAFSSAIGAFSAVGRSEVMVSGRLGPPAADFSAGKADVHSESGPFGGCHLSRSVGALPCRGWYSWMTA